jgi:tRNA pseudouridine55 synthase
MTGLLLVDKPAGMTSHDVVDRIRKAAGIRRVGHTGTLDPSATGLLILCLGQATRLSEHLTGLEKTYEGEMRLGITTTSYDLDGEVTAESPVPELSMERISAVCQGFTGEIEQLPPMVSAVKVGGQRLYKMARKGQEVERPPRKVTVHEFDVLAYESPNVSIRVRCTSGTYVRSLCHDAGQILGCGAVLARLRRTWVGEHSVDEAAPLDAFQTPDDVAARLLPMDHALRLPEVTVLASGREALVNGSTLVQANIAGDCPVKEGWVQIKGKGGRLLALGVVQPTAAGVRIQPKRVFMK